MLSISKMLSGQEEVGDALRYHFRERPVGPVVVWNSTRACNLRCRHCYASATPGPAEGELTTAEAQRFIDGLAEANVPVLLFSGGEPLLRPDFFELVNYARERGIRPVISTNGTLITREVAQRIKEAGVGYVGISLDGLEELNDRMRAVKGAYKLALTGIKNCVAVGQRVGLRFTITRENYQDVAAIFDLVEQEEINRVCFYHLVTVGRGRNLREEDLDPATKRKVVDLIIERTADFVRRGLGKEILTVDNHADAVYIYLKLRQTNPARAEEVYAWLARTGGNRSGSGIGAVDWFGNVYPDQFTQNHPLGNVRERKFGEIWYDPQNELLNQLRNRKPLLKGRCGACRWLEICNGNFRARAEAVHNDFWAPDPGCYLTDEEIGVAG
ncbi:radical SAM protein with 4Fe4S-binding SPASM domain [Thermodesulfitimonas autotrophica]|uniref:Mycofactocin maturase MftC n=1 Tax=Thermodesulfitimonas autotrophica TaxID=1894989 RepID=A0A3N5ACZ8_9THEO|nr:radical SAM protein [Thermodesulfitimonas autotrophica]RPF42474.1 radical SAM protein with 4Fe4S-binding SPASM domain [Thermodesulfitimonas autotrophica]